MPRTQPLPSSPTELDGVQKAAILLLNLKQETAAGLLRALPADVVEQVTHTLATLGDVPPRLSAAVVEEFYNLRMAHQQVKVGGLDYARDLLKESLDPATSDDVIAEIQAQVQRSPFSFLERAESGNLLTFIQDEHPQTIALIVSHLPRDQASDILVGLPVQKQVEVVRRIANMERANPEVIREVESGLQSRLSTMLGHPADKVGGVETIAEILNLCDRASERTIMDGIEAEDPDLVEEIRRLMFVFEDIIDVNDKGIQAILKEIDNDELALALRTASDELKEKIFGNMSARAAELIQEEMKYMGPVRVSDVEAAQRRIVDVTRRLEDAGELIITGRGGDSELIV